MLEYFNSTHGARKGLADTALEDGELGLSDPSSRRRGAGLHHQRGGLRHRQRHHHAGRSSMPARSSPRSATRILGRTAAEDITDPVTGEVIVPRPAR